jgi:hypothetical protein
LSFIQGVRTPPAQINKKFFGAFFQKRTALFAGFDCSGPQLTPKDQKV